MADFDKAVPYVFGNEGAFSNDDHDFGGVTFWGISKPARDAHRCQQHPNGVTDADFIGSVDHGKALARHIYQSDFWKFDGVKDQRVATKAFDVVVNCGVDEGVKLIQCAVGTFQDGIYGPQTEYALNDGDPDNTIERIALAESDHYVSRCIAMPSQWVFLKGWERRAIRRPPR